MNLIGLIFHRSEPIGQVVELKSLYATTWYFLRA